jgi:hypothetical protein
MRRLTSRATSRYNRSWNANSSSSSWNILQDDGIRTNECVIADFHASENFGTRANVDMATEDRDARLGASYSYGHLLKYQTVRTYDGFWKNNDAIWMREEKAAIDVAVKRDLGSSYDAPKAMLNNPILTQPSKGNLALLPLLVLPYRSQQTTCGIPEAHASFATPVRRMCRDLAVVGHEGY